MNSEKVNNWLQVVGMSGIMASLVFIGFQVRQAQAIGEGMKGNLKSCVIFGNAIRARIAELQKIEPDPKYDVKWCGM